MLIITNNPYVNEKYKNSYFIVGTSKELLTKVRDMIYKGHELISHPLGASLRMMLSPYRSIIITDKVVTLNNFHVEIVSKSIEMYINTIGRRKNDLKNEKDYAAIDLLLLESALKEVAKV